MIGRYTSDPSSKEKEDSTEDILQSTTDLLSLEDWPESSDQYPYFKDAKMHKKQRRIFAKRERQRVFTWKTKWKNTHSGDDEV